MLNYLVEMLKKLTDNYAKDANSKIGKLFNLVSTELEQADGAFTSIENYRDIDQATGETLDRIGKNVQQFRGAANDDIYRILIKSKIARNLSTGDVNTIIRILAITLNADESNIAVEELYSSSAPESAAVFISVPATHLNSIGFSITQFGRFVNRIVAAGIKANALSQGAFSFSAQLAASEADSNAGFADVLQTTGGFFGAAYDPGNDIDLPLD